ncbi:MAG: deoxyribodipyrimidine photo-lyase [Prolixibacteraceae bacterium]|jgi:deoxyribodipyrimidine photo-lyase|nr:deoxyribodipyrimidine photo-lyase [Prolixibacteraceae bacterium]
MKPFSLSIHIFRRDLRLNDNTALMAALEKSERVVPVFIFDERQLDNPYRGHNSFEFMINSLIDIDQKLKAKGSQLYFFKGVTHEIVSQLIEKLKPGALFFNRDYTPFSRERDETISNVCKKRKIELNVYADALLNEPEMVHKEDGTPYTVFTPFMKKARLNSVSEPVHNLYSNYYNKNIEIPSSFHTPKTLMISQNPTLLVKGGRTEGLKLLEQIEKLADYEKQRELPSIQGTSLLSAHHKFGTVSVRETYQKLVSFFGKQHPMINELYWRDFFTHIVWHFPHVLGNAFREKYDKIEWSHDEQKFERWCNGQTGFPIVDAGMRELVSTGYMHNRVRMIVAAFLTKDLHIDWRWGERFFASHLTDYDPAVNNGNWQWGASTGCDAQPYFRIFNPWRQQHRFDHECKYIKKWVPELKEFTAKQIHDIEKRKHSDTSYPEPMLMHKEEAVVAKAMFNTNYA